MKLQEAPSCISKVVKFPSSVTSYQKSEDIFHEQFHELNGGLLKDTHYAWLSCGPNFKVIRTSNGAKVAAWTFGAVLRDSKTRVTCVTELPNNDGSGRVAQFVVGLECELVGGMICIFDIRGSRVLRAIQMPSKVVCMSVVDSGTGGCFPLPQILSSMTGVLAVGLAGGEVLLLDLCRCSYDEGVGILPSSELRDEVYACQLLRVNIREIDPETLEMKRAHAARSGDHLCVVLNESFVSERMFLLPLSDSDPISISRRRVNVTALMYVPRIASVVVGFNFGGFQIWNLMNLSLEYMSPAMQDPLPIVSFGFQEPCDDPRNHCYLWVVHSNGSSHKQQLPFAVMYALCYQNKEWVDGYGYLNQEFESCVQQFDFDMDADDSGNTMVGGCCIACHTINKVSPGAAAAKRDRADFDESIQESDLTLCQFVWETWGVNCPGSTQMALFDLNQWYKEQMPSKIMKGHASTYMTMFSLDEVVEGMLHAGNPLLDVRVDPASISQFTAVQSLEEHYYPSSLAFESLSLLGEELVMLNHPGVQRDILSQLEQSGPTALLHPTKLFHHCIAIGLKPMYTDISSTNCLLTEQREFLLSVALEHQLIGFLSRCATEWMDGSQSTMSCTLAGLLKWGWQRATTLKTHIDNLCIPLYDHSGERLDSNSFQLLHYCGNQMHHLTTLFQGVLKVCKNPHIKGVGDIAEQTRVLELVTVYIEVVEWFVNVGLLPEFPCPHFTLTDDIALHRVPYPAAALANIYKNRREELDRLSRSATDTTDILFIDGLVKRECNGDRLSSLWERDGGTGLYPPPSIQSLLRIYLLDGIPMHVKHCIVIYVFLDLAGLLESERYVDTINQFIKFPSAFRMTPSFIKITQALWLLDHQDFMEAIDMLLDPLVSINDLKPWQHQCIIRAFLYQGQHQMALKYVRVQQPPLKDIEDIRLNLTVLLVNGLIHEGFQYQRHHLNEQNSKDLLQHFFNACQQMNQLSVVLQLALSPAEEEAFSQFLQSCQNSRADDVRVMYYLERSRIAEAIEVNDSIRSSKSHIEMSCLKRSRLEDKPICVRDTIVQAYANTLPSVTRKLAQYCAQEKLKAFTWKQVARPTPMSVAVHRGESQPVRYRSSLIQATLEKARETWNHLSSPCTPGKRDRSSMEKPSVEMTPFLCTPRAASQTPGIQRDITDVVFPTLTYPSPKTDDEVMGGSPVKRFRYSEHYPTSLGSTTPSQRKRLDRYSSVDAQSLLQTPHVRRKTLSMSRQEQNDTTVFTPQSILKVRKLVQRSVSPDNMSLASSSTTPDLPAGEEEQVDEQMQVSDEEFPTGRQIHFSFPMVQEDRGKSKTPDMEEHIGAVTRSAIKRSLLGGTPRKALSRTRRTPGVRFGTEKRMDSNTSISWIVKDKSTVETKSIVEENNESSSMENDSDAFHSLENSGSVESPMKKQRVDSPKSNTEEQTAESRTDNIDTKSVESTVQDDVDEMETSSKITDSLLLKETLQQEKSLDRIFTENNAGELATSNNAIISDETSCHGSFDMSYEDEEEAVSANDKGENSNADEPLMNLEEERKGILLEDTTYHGSSFELSYEAEAQEISANDKEHQDENSNADEALINHMEEHKGILLEDTTYHGSSFEVSYEGEADETEEKERSEGEEVVVEPCKLQEQPGDIEENNTEPCMEEVELQELPEDGLLLSQEITSSNGEEQAYAEYCNGVYEVEEPDALPSLIIESVNDNIKEDGDYETLQSAAVMLSDEESNMVMIPTLPDVLQTGDKDSEEEEDGEEEESSPCVRWKSGSDDEASVVVLDSDSEAETATVQLCYNEESDDEIEEEEEEIESEHKSDDDSSIEAPDAKHKVSDDKFSTSDDGETGQVGNTSSEESEEEYKAKVENVTTGNGNVNKNVIVEEFDSSEDSLHRVREYITFEEHENSGSLDETAVQNVRIEEPNTSGEDPCISQEIVSIEEVCEEYEIVQSKMSTTVDKASVEDEERHEIESSRRRPDDNNKEKMDFEDCISFNEISKSGYNQVSQAMDIDKDGAMDFEVEIAASQISKPKICKPDVCTETMEVQVVADKSNDTNSSAKYEALDSTLVRKSELRKSRSRSGSVPPENTGPNKLGKTMRATSAPPEDISYSNQIKIRERNTEVEVMDLNSDFKKEDLLQVIQEEPYEAEASVCKLAQTRGGSVPPSSSHKSKIRKSRRSSSLEPEDNINKPTYISVEFVRRKICKPENEAAKDTETGVLKPASVEPEDIYVKVTVEKTQKAENKIISVPPDGIPATVVDKKPQKATGRARSVPPEDVSEKKPHKAGNRAGSVPRDCVSVVDTEKRIGKTGSLPPEDVKGNRSCKAESLPEDEEIKTGSEDLEVLDKKLQKSVEVLDKKLRKSGKRSGSVPPADVEVENKSCKAGGRSGSIPEDDVPAVDTEMETGPVTSEDVKVVDKKLRKSGKRTGLVPPADVVDVENKSCKAGGRSGSIPEDDVPAVDTEMETGPVTSEDVKVVDKKLRKSGKRTGLVPPADVVDVENKSCKAGGRSGSIPEDDVPAVDTEMETGPVTSEDVKVVDKKLRKSGKRTGLVPPADVVDVENESCKAGGRSGSIPEDDVPAVAIEMETGPVTSEDVKVVDKKLRKSGKRTGSVPPADVVEVENKSCKAGGRSGSIPEDDVPAVDTEMETGPVTSEDVKVVNKKLRKSGKRTGLVPLADVVDVENESCKAGGRSGSIPEDDVPAVDTEMETGPVTSEDVKVVDKKLRKSGKRNGLVPPADVVDVENKSCKAGGRSGSIPEDDVPAVDTEMETGPVTSEDVKVVDKKLRKSGKRTGLVPPADVVVVENKSCKAGGRSGSIPEDDVPPVDIEMETGSVRPEDATEKESQKSALVEENVCVDRPSSLASTVCNEDVDNVCSASVSSQASTVHLKPNRSRQSSISSQASSVQEDMRLDVVYEEPEDDVGSVVKNRRLSGDFELRVRRTRSESGSVHGIQTRRSTRRAASVMEGCVVTTLRSGKAISESEDDVDQTVKADSTSGGDSINSQQIIEEYAIARRLTRHQRSLLERSLELAKTSSQSSRLYRLPTLPETSDDECETSSVGTRSSSRISARHAHATGNSSPNTSQASTVHILGSESSPAKTPRRSRRSLSRLNDSFMDSPSSVRSDASTVYASSVTSLASPTSTRSEDVTGSRMRRRSFQKAQEVFRSVSERSFPVRSKVSSPTNSDVSSESSSGILTRSAVVRLSRLKGEDLGSPSSFQFSPPTVVPGAGKKEGPSSPVPAFVFSPPQKQQPHPKPHRSQVTSQKIRAHTMALRGLHTITEEAAATSSPLSSGELQSSERIATPIAVKRSKRSRPRISIMTPLTEEEKREVAQRQQSGRQSSQLGETRRYSAFKQRKVMRLLKSKSSKPRP